MHLQKSSAGVGIYYGMLDALPKPLLLFMLAQARWLSGAKLETAFAPALHRFRGLETDKKYHRLHSG
jgi:hypothetical protein